MNVQNSLAPVANQNPAHLTFDQTINQLRITLPRRTTSVSVLISGAGPAGLMRAIESTCNGCKTKVLEKRAEIAEGRLNAVHIEANSVEILTRYGIFQYLMERALIFPPDRSGGIDVRICDLEMAMKAVLAAISTDPIIEYGSIIESFTHVANKVSVVTDRLKKFEPIDILINAEGSKSVTNDRYGKERIEVLPKIPAIAAIFKDDRPRIQGVSSFFDYVGKSVRNIAIRVYYCAVCIFKMVFQGQHIWNENRSIAGAALLPTPGQNYLGCGLSRDKSAELLRLKRRYERLQRACDLTPDGPLRERAMQECASAKLVYESFAKYWINLSFSFASILYLLGLMNGRSGELFPIHSFSVVELGADRVEDVSFEAKDTMIFLTGDAAATVDPASGLGCNKAIQESDSFSSIFQSWATNAQRRVLAEHNYDINYGIERAHRMSIHMRRLYRPDAV